MPEDRRSHELGHARPGEPARRAFLRYSGVAAAAGGVAGAAARAGLRRPPGAPSRNAAARPAHRKRSSPTRSPRHRPPRQA